MHDLRYRAPLTLFPLLLLPALLLAAAPLAAQMPADAIFREFQPSGDFAFELGGKKLDHAEIYHSERAAAYLVIAPELASPLLINPRTQTVESVHLMKVAKREDGSIDLLADATFDALGNFQITAEQEVAFEVKGQPAKLAPKPPLLGQQQSAELRSYKPEYDRGARAYDPAPQALQALRGVKKEVRVLTYFGTWCPVCGRLVPRLLRLEEALAGSKIDFQYYGLPHDLESDPATERDDVHGVPTCIVYVEGKEVARLSVKELNEPATALQKVLKGV